METWNKSGRGIFETRAIAGKRFHVTTQHEILIFRGLNDFIGAGFFVEMCAFIHYFLLSVVSVCLTRLCLSLFEQPSHNSIHEPTCAVAIALYTK